MGDDTYEPAECQLKWMEMLTGTARQAMDYSDDLVPAVGWLQQASLVAVDVVRGEAADADLRRACEASLRGLDGCVNVHPMRKALRAVIEGIDEAMAEQGPGADPLAAVPDADNALQHTRDLPHKERAPRGR